MCLLPSKHGELDVARVFFGWPGFCMVCCLPLLCLFIYCTCLWIWRRLVTRYECRKELMEVSQRYSASGDELRAKNQAREAYLRVGSELSEWFEGKQGVRQG